MLRALSFILKTKVLTPQCRVKNKPACSQQTSSSTSSGLLLDCTHSLPSHPLFAGGVNFPLSFSSGGMGVQVHAHTTTPQGFKRSHKEKSNSEMPTGSSSNGGRLTNPAIKKTYTRRLNVTFPNNSNFKGIKSLSMLYPKQSFSKRLNQSIRNDSQTHSPQSPVISTQNVLASSKFTSNMEQKRLL